MVEVHEDLDLRVVYAGAFVKDTYRMVRFLFGIVDLLEVFDEVLG
jgi:hypothetical protein